MPGLCAGTDPGKSAHHCTLIDTEGTKVLSRRVPNNEAELLELMGDVLALAEDERVTWAVDLNAGGAVLLIALLASQGQRLLHIPRPHRAPCLPQLSRQRQDRCQRRLRHRRPGADAPGPAVLAGTGTRSRRI
nr:transposase [Streptomyces atratus]